MLEADADTVARLEADVIIIVVAIERARMLETLGAETDIGVGIG